MIVQHAEDHDVRDVAATEKGTQGWESNGKDRLILLQIKLLNSYRDRVICLEHHNIEQIIQRTAINPFEPLCPR